MAKRRRVIFLNRFFFPDHSATSELLSDLAFALAERGFDANVVTSRQSYERAKTNLPAREGVNGVDIARVWTSRRGRLRLVGRSIDYLTFYLAAAWHVWKAARAGDIIVAKTDPPLLSVPMAIVAKMRRAYLVNWLQDVFPEVAEALNVGGRVGRIASGALRPLRNWSLRAAKVNVVVGEHMARRLRAIGIDNVEVITNWSDSAIINPLRASDSEFRQDWVPGDHFVVCYAGNLGRAHDIDTLLSAMTLLQERAKNSPSDLAAKIMFVFVGGGALRARLECEALKRKLTNFRVRPYQPKERLGETLAVADVHLVSLNPALEGLIVPSKFYGIAAAGRPTIFIGAKDGEIARQLEEFRCGFTVVPGDGETLVNKILELATDKQLCATLGTRARLAFERQWNKEQALTKWEALLQAVSEAELGERS
jgi:glycosyltransferase involved in cell wall biosynthesis